MSKSVQPTGEPGGRPPVRFSKAAAQAIWDGEHVKHTPDGRVDRSASLVRIARLLLEVGLTPAAVVEALSERDLALGWEKYSGRDDALAQYQRIVSLVLAGRRAHRLA